MDKMIKVMKKLIARIMEADVVGLSAQLAYFFLLSLFPFLLFLVTLMGFIPLNSESVMQFIDSFMPGDVAELIETNINDLVNNRSGGLLSVSILGTLWSASNGFNAITKSFNKAYKVDESRSFIWNRLIALGLMLVLVLVIAVALIGAVFGKVIGEQIFGFLGLDNIIDAWNVIRWIVTSVTLIVALFLIYKVAPNEKIKAKDAIWGAVFATITWQVVSLGFAFYVNNLGNYSATYGSLGTVIVLMIWFYLSGIIITTGGVINAFIKRRRPAEE